MKEIKFRAWDKEEKKMIDTSKGLYISTIVAKELVLQRMNNDFDYILLQYTGLKDKNGKEIYEGDILKWKRIDHQFNVIDEQIGEVQFRSGVFWAEVIKNGSRGQLHKVYELANKDYKVVSENCEITGNIYENPLLLNQK